MTSEKRNRAVVLLSGGMDSCVTTAIARLQYDLALLHVDYHQRTSTRERQSFEAIADHYQVSRRWATTLDHLRTIGGSSLTDPGVEVSPANLNSTTIPSSYVPFRNAHLLSIATSWAEVMGATRIFIGAVAEDSSGYPDCRRQFYDAFERAIEAGTKPETHIRIETPVIAMRKSEIVRKGIELNAPLHLTWSCYRNTEVACGECDSCALRLRGFQQAGVEDPIPYARRPSLV
ncbi:MAG: 7-cyano-7-deazaguanine synthase QueC [Acidobacteriia bacterium]|nr:7-cyano-7-deazaguanine synthase QueC [Terriglobia bacterium]